MKSIAGFFGFTLLMGVLSSQIAGQDDEARQATGLPMVIGENSARGNRMNVSGRITLETQQKLARLPVITVLVVYSGVTADRAIATDSGHFVIRNVPRENVSIVVEVDGMEMIRQPIVASAMGSPRFDFTIPWPRQGPAAAPPTVISAGSLYKRNEKNEELFKKALAADKANDTGKAITHFNELLAADPKDFVAWTELGTLFFKSNALDNAEACYFKAIEVKRDYLLALLNLGKLYISRKQTDNSILVLSNAVAANPSSAEAHRLLGEAYLMAKKGSSAAHHFNEAIKLSPTELAEVHLRLAALYDAGGMKKKASAEYKEFLVKRPDYADKKDLEKYIADNPPG